MAENLKTNQGLQNRGKINGRDYVTLHKSVLLDIIQNLSLIAQESLKSNQGDKKDSGLTIKIENLSVINGDLNGGNSNVNCSNSISFESDTSDNLQFSDEKSSETLKDAFKIIFNRLLKWILKFPIVTSFLSGEIQWWREWLLIIFTNS